MNFDTKRIAKNTLMLYFRQLFCMGISFYTVRVVLNVLGVEDYGIYNVVAGVVTMFGFFSGAMSSASLRYFSFNLREKRSAELHETFCCCFFLFLFFSVVSVILSEIVGMYFIFNKLHIPSNRMAAALYVFHTSVVVMTVTMMEVPYMTMIIAHEKMNVYASVSILDSVLKLAVVTLLGYLNTDKLFSYGMLLALEALLILVVYVVYCTKKYCECRIKFVWNPVLLRAMFSFVSWNIFGALTTVAKLQGVNILLNIYFGPTVNAARAIANQINGGISSFSGNFNMATKPQIIKTYAMHDSHSCMQLVFFSCKLNFFLIFVFALPVILEMSNILSIWLKTIPDCTVVFARLTLVELTITGISWPIMTLVDATGKIRLYQCIVGGIQLLEIPLAYIAFNCQARAESVFMIAVILAVLSTIARLFILRHITDFSICKFFKSVFLPIISISIFSSLIGYVIKRTLNGYEYSFIMTCVICVPVIILLFFMIGLNREERKIFIGNIRKRINAH